MTPEPMPTVFVSHGAPTLTLEHVPARQFLVDLGSRYRSVRAVLCISAHWNTVRPCVNTGKNHETIHDFYGFPPELYHIEYPATGSPNLAGQVVDLLKNAGFTCEVDPTRGLDHGAWVPLRLMFPKAEVPIVQLSIQQSLDPAYHVTLGEAIREVRETDVLVLGSGGAVHPLGNPQTSMGPGAPTGDWAIEFNAWLSSAVTRGDRVNLVNYRTIAPYARQAHPYPDHYMPLLAAFGAAGPGARGMVLHQSWNPGDLGMGAFEFIQ
ncbi:MAG: class III extradiol ring-cleavage dioxygenase [Methanoregula sp.]|jgi:4,5-DOPA dioxygenase extradiol|nr:class III extradiol ring-cleavage dioxygenase [Methanoregula sp.]